jgi:hypothetical protein
VQNVHVCRLLNGSKAYACAQRANVLLITRISHNWKRGGTTAGAEADATNEEKSPHTVTHDSKGTSACIEAFAYIRQALAPLAWASIRSHDDEHQKPSSAIF